MSLTKAYKHQKSAADKALERALMSPLALIMRRGRAAGRRLAARNVSSLITGGRWRPTRSKILAVFLLLAGSARADCVWVPLCMPYQTPGVDALRIYHDGVLSREIRPMWAATGGRTNLWTCGRSGSRLRIDLVRGDEVVTMNHVGKVGLDPLTCTGGDPLPTPPTISSYYGPREQTLRAIQQLYTTNDPHPIDTDQDGTIRDNDMLLIWRHILGLLPDATDNICTAENCP